MPVLSPETCETYGCLYDLLPDKNVLCEKISIQQTQVFRYNSYLYISFEKFSMKRHFFIISCFLAIFTFYGCSDDNDENSNSTKKSKVLIDTDMMEGFDDGVAMMLLLSAPDVDVVGVTTVSGNTWAQEGVAYGIRQMEICNAKNVPIIAGSEYPLREGRLSTLKDEVSSNPGNDSSWLGAANYERVDNWKNYYAVHYGEQPSISATSDDAADFIIRMLHTYPGELTLLAIGPCTNIAKAIMKEPGIERLAKEIVYMGGSYFTDGNTTPYAEFNAIYDPEAMAVCLRAPFAQQTIVSLDVCNTITMDKNRYDDMCSKIKNDKLLQIYHNCHHYSNFKENPNATSYIWDVVSAAVIIDKGIITSSKNVRVDVQDDPSMPEYGRTYVTEKDERQYAQVLTGVKTDRIWDLIYQSLNSPGNTHGPIKR